MTATPAVTLDELADLPALIRRYGVPNGDGLLRVEVRLCLTVPESNGALPLVEHETLAALRQARRDMGRAVPTRAVAARLYVSRTTAWKRLKALEARGIVERVGQRSGWVLAGG